MVNGQQSTSHSPIFKISFPVQKKGAASKFAHFLERGIEKSLRLDALGDLFNSVENRGDACSFIKGLFDTLNVSMNVKGNGMEGIPKDGKVIVVANHPFGGVEGLILGYLLRSVRGDAKIMANEMLKSIPELRDLFLFVDPFGKMESVKKNIRGMRASLSWLSEDRMLGVFPSGEVSAFRLKERTITEPHWSPSIARIAERTGAQVLPVYFSGTNSLSFHLAGLIHPKLRTALLPHQFMNKANTNFDIHIGDLIKPREYNQLNSHAAVSYFEVKTKLPGLRKESANNTVSAKTQEQPLALPQPVDRIEQEIEALHESHKLVEHDTCDVYVATDAQIPYTLKEIGRLRELSFRTVGEGSGKTSDLDDYDRYYKHLFIWDKEKKCVVGSYRLAPVKQTANIFGSAGLYTHSLFKFGQPFLNVVGNGIELGRSFVHPDYQRSFLPLLLLWKGIGAYVVKHPEVRYLIGAVSMSNGYSAFSRQLMVEYLREHHMDPVLIHRAEARNPFKGKRDYRFESIKPYLSELEISHIDALIKTCDPKMGGIPILIKQYLKLGGKMAGFNVDSSFSDVVDGFIVVDLQQTEDKQLKRYFGDEGLQSYRAYQAKFQYKAGAIQTQTA